ncbi:Imm10 family immunity protein (plasmid) [Deinococcus sp. KNUC1210]|uniref:Imm10 family immunity protein n=1 Tax=Deinococcus sp. KNUC1210 TaxID=2917691 RepID=UPI001EF05BB9|nr:Imm10 family immunity protein [Deinococcus sp. KNUC1210]ULH18191.1 Imm10 family immunity protein [Deinococcus sp. KNUC1210]
MVFRFTAWAFSALNLHDLKTFLIALADDADAPTCTLELQKALEVDVDDPDAETSCLIVDGAAMAYGGTDRCHLTDDSRAACTLSTPQKRFEAPS